MITLCRSDLPPAQLPGELISLFYFSDVQIPLIATDIDAACGEKLATSLQSGSLFGRAGEHLLLPATKLMAEKVLFVGGGSWAGLSPATYHQLVLHQLQTALYSGHRRLVLCLMPLPEQSPDMVETMVASVLTQFDSFAGECLLSVVTS